MTSALTDGVFASKRAGRLPRGDAALEILSQLLLIAGAIGYYTEFKYAIYYIALFFIIILGFFRGYRYIRVKPFYPLILFWCYQAASSFWSPDSSVGLYQSLIDLAFFGFAIIYSFRPDYKLDLLPLSLSKCLGLAMLICAAISYWKIGEFVDDEKGSFRTLTAVGFLVSIPGFVYYIFKNKSVWSMIVLLAIMIIGFDLSSRVFTIFSIPALLGSVFIHYFSNSRSTRLLIPAAFFMAIAGGLGLYVAAGDLLDQSRLSAADTSFSLGDTVFAEANAPGTSAVDIERRVATQVALDSFTAHPFVGAGYMSTSYYVSQLTRFETPAHGLLTGVLGETGAVGGLIFLFVLIRSLQGFWRAARNAGAANREIVLMSLLSLVGALAAGLFHQTNHDFYLYLFLGMGLTLRAAQSDQIGVVVGMTEGGSSPVAELV